jgi:hypothetical protein
LGIAYACTQKPELEIVAKPLVDDDEIGRFIYTYIYIYIEKSSLEENIELACISALSCGMVYAGTGNETVYLFFFF